MLHPEIETEEDMWTLLRDHAELAQLLIEDPEADRCEMGPRLFDELMALRELNELEELKKAKAALEEKDRQKDQFIVTWRMSCASISSYPLARGCAESDESG